MFQSNRNKSKHNQSGAGKPYMGKLPKKPLKNQIRDKLRNRFSDQAVLQSRRPVRDFEAERHLQERVNSHHWQGANSLQRIQGRQLASENRPQDELPTTSGHYQPPPQPTYGRGPAARHYEAPPRAPGSHYEAPPRAPGSHYEAPPRPLESHYCVPPPAPTTDE